MRLVLIANPWNLRYFRNCLHLTTDHGFGTKSLLSDWKLKYENSNTKPKQKWYVVKGKMIKNFDIYIIQLRCERKQENKRKLLEQN